MKLRLVGDTLYLGAAAHLGAVTPEHRVALTGFQAGQVALLLARFTPDNLETEVRRDSVPLLKQIALACGYRVSVRKAERSAWVRIAFTPLAKQHRPKSERHAPAPIQL